MAKAPSTSNFRYLNPDLPATQRIIEASLTIFDPVPRSQDDGPRFERPAIAQLADRIYRRAQQGLTVHLKPETARTVAMTMQLYAEGPPDLRNHYTHHVEDRTTAPQTVLAYCVNAQLAIGAWEAFAPQQSERRLVATWGGWVARDNRRNRA
jgi:hypothetical protein